MRSAFAIVIAITIAIAVILLGLRLIPKPPLANRAPYSAAVYAEDATLLRLTTASDEQYRLWTSYDAISPKLIEAVLRYEDRYYYWHPGVNPAALIRSASATFSSARRQGGSTITMQLARKIYDIDSRSISGKFKQIAAAFWLEARYSKRDILEAYLNFAPYGGNIEGVGAASLVYFHKRAANLTTPEALTLAVIPQNPTGRGGNNANAPALALARQRMADIWLKAHPDDERLGANHSLILYGTAALPFRTPHLANQLLKEMVNEGLNEEVNERRDEEGNKKTNTKSGEIFSSIDLKLQATLERSIAQRIEQQRTAGVRNASAILIDTETMKVKAMVGSANFWDDDIDGQVNGVQAKRSPGSTLKPFIYALAFDQGVLHPMTVLKDAPTAFGPYSPENFDGRFIGPITAQDALTRSRNVPAVQVASRLTRPSLYDLMKEAGVTNLASEKHYGLALTLGGGEVTMEELAKMYAMLANRGELRNISYVTDAYSPKKAASASTTRLVSEEAAFVILDMLKTNPRPDTGLPASPAVSWKTGTSWGFRDAWTAGVFGRYVLVVWVGNFDGASNPAFIGVSAAAPLFFNIVDGMRNEGVIVNDAPRLPPPKLTRVEVCAGSGDLPNIDCPQRVSTWYVPGKSPIRISQLHKRVLMDRRTGAVVCDENAFTEWQVIELWPTDMQRLFKEAGMPRRAPPPMPHCAGQISAAANQMPTTAPQIVSPLRAVTYTMRLSKPAPISLRAEGAGSGYHHDGKQFWFSNDAFIGEVKTGEALAWQPPKAGRYLLRVVDEAGLADSRDINVEIVP